MKGAPGRETMHGALWQTAVDHACIWLPAMEHPESMHTWARARCVQGARPSPPPHTTTAPPLTS